MRIKAAVLLAVVFGTAGVVAGGDAKGDLKKFEGTWSVVSAKKGGKDAPEEEKIKDVRLTFSGDKLTIKHGDKTMEGTFKIDPGKKPRQIEVTMMDKGVEGIYRFKKGGLLEICVNEPGGGRPTEFKSPEDSKTMLLVLKRVKE
jgi:uncharacterized protein (TIGR03067 family)